MVEQSANKLKPETVRKRLDEADRLLQEATENQRQVYKETRARCPHDWSYVPDPSGNNDSGYNCNTCGAWSRTWQKSG
jgi:uncharacterized UBP type Zn finger protein